MNVEFLSVMGVGLIGASVVVLFRQYKPEYTLLVSIIVCVVISGAVWADLSGLMEELGDLLEQTALPAENIKIVVKCLGVCFVSQVACDTCRDAGQNAIATKIETAGKISILVMSLPLFRQLLTTVTQLL